MRAAFASRPVGGVLTGRGADVIIIDGPLKREEATSESQCRAVNEGFGGPLYPRLDNKAKGAIVIVKQWLHEDDLVGCGGAHPCFRPAAMTTKRR